MIEQKRIAWSTNARSVGERNGFFFILFRVHCTPKFCNSIADLVFSCKFYCKYDIFITIELKTFHSEILNDKEIFFELCSIFFFR
jgi:hypothetical protein